MLLAMCASPVVAAVLSIDGEVYAGESKALMPPSIDGVWMLNITRIAPDGSPVKVGEVVLGFDGNSLMQDLNSKNSKLGEKQRELETLLLDLAERERTERLATAEARADVDKARRKTGQPQALIPGTEYRKLIIARERAERRLSLAEERERLSAEQRRQERRLVEAEIAQLQGEVAHLQDALASLEVKAPREGLMMHKSSWSGDKFDVGSQVFRGQAVAEIPDTGTLAVRGDLPERDLSRVRIGMPVRVVVEGGAGIAVAGRIEAVGRAVRSKSRVQPVPVLDLEIALGDAADLLKPGQSVRVEVQVADEQARSAGAPR
ncbi:HlyD family secretion protein [Novilysobacter spongiicola]|uniref:HlyD family secretion protein n=1 Tax=Novilysobacter spongiicola TaxID=435289 RepID=UPI0013566C8E|nr:HlyD family efflux transporter periplasmic adaptor subunit [Lysobacter spongiicola]